MASSIYPLTHATGEAVHAYRRRSPWVPIRMRMDRACAKSAQEAGLTDPAYAFFDYWKDSAKC